MASGSLVIDVGGYRGDFVSRMRDDWDARVITVEPIPEFAASLKKRFADDASVTVLPVALGATSGSVVLSFADDGSSAWFSGPVSVQVPLVDVCDVVQDNEVGLLKINAEGAEFDIIERLLETGSIRQIRSVRVQFHRFVPLAVMRRRRIRRQLRATHRCSWNVPWVWEQWVRR